MDYSYKTWKINDSQITFNISKSPVSIIFLSFLVTSFTCQAQPSPRDAYEMGKIRGAIAFNDGLQRGCEQGAELYAGFAEWLSESYTYALNNSSPNSNIRKELLRVVEDKKDDYLNTAKERHTGLEKNARVERSSFSLGYVSGLDFSLSFSVRFGLEHENRSKQTYKRLIEQRCKSEKVD